MNKETIHERIEAYLAGELPAAEREALERDIAADPELAAEVALHRRLERVVSDKEKIAFRQKVAEVAQEFPPPDAAAKRFPGRGIFILILVIALGIFLRTYLLNKTAPDPVPPPAILQDTIAETVPRGTDTKEIPDTVQPAAPKTQRPVRSPFAPNPALEKETAQPRDAYVSVETAVLEAFPGETTGTRQIRFSGRMLTALEPPELELVILDNSLPDGKPVLRLPVVVTLIEDGNRFRAFAGKKAYNLEAAQTAALPEGLYYGRLVIVGQTTSLWTGKF
jgi:hypothetical protein